MLRVNTIRHSLAHILAYAIQELYPGVKFGIGPAIENGFYYDFDFNEVKIINPKLQIPNSKQILNSKIQNSKQIRDGILESSQGVCDEKSQNSKQEFKLTPDDLPKIEKKMQEIIKQNLEFRIKNLEFKEAKELFKKQPYKLELIDEIRNSPTDQSVGLKQVSIYKCGDFIDLCKGPHIKSTKEINPKAFKLTKIAGAYWRGDEKNPMLTRIYGIAFNEKKEFDDYLKLQEQAEARDHRKLGQELDLFIMPPETGAGLVLWQPKGTILRKIIENFWIKEHIKKDYIFLTTPHIYSSELWKISGHYDWYKESMMFTKIEDQEYGIKPMNCNGHVLIYKSKIRSYKDLPLKYAELGTVYRAELSGVLHGLMRPRGFTQDDAHIICTEKQMTDELCKVVDLVFYMYKIFGFKDCHVELSTKPEKSIGSDKIWNKATKALKKALETKKIKYQLNPGEGAFYGPKIDFHVKDAIGRSWQCGTIQLDFNLPERFKMVYIDNKGHKQQPIMIHRTILGSIERFLGVLIEHYAAVFPVWLSPIQVYIIPVGSAHIKASQKLAQELKKQGIRCEIDDLNETVGYKIRKSEKLKVPYMLVIGDKEAKGKILNVRIRGQKKVVQMTRNKFMERIKKEIEKKK